MTWTTRRPFGDDALAACADALASGSLSSIGGPWTLRFEAELAAYYGARHAVAVSSGTASIHCAVAALDLEPGSEVVVGPVTDAGSVVPLLFQGLVPVFCDLDEHLAMTVDTIEAVLTDRTRAVMLVHLFGGVSDARAVRRLCDERGLTLLEDCSQAHATRLHSEYVGRYGHVGMFSMQQSKHLTTGDGGFCLTDDDTLATRLRLFRDKGWDRSATGARGYPTLGLNYRITELQSAVGVPQLPRLASVLERRRAIAARLDDAVRAVPGLAVWQPPPGGAASYWCYPFFVPAAVRDAYGAALAARGLPVTPGYIGSPIFDCLAATRDRVTFGTSGYPFTLAPHVTYDAADVPCTVDALSRLMVLWAHEDLTDDDVAGACRAIADAAAEVGVTA